MSYWSDPLTETKNTRNHFYKVLSNKVSFVLVNTLDVHVLTEKKD
jgi:hypothetical protein